MAVRRGRAWETPPGFWLQGIRGDRELRNQDRFGGEVESPVLDMFEVFGIRRS